MHNQTSTDKILNAVFQNMTTGSQIGDMVIRVFRNTSTKRFWIKRLPLNQTLIWLGPVFILIQRH